MRPARARRRSVSDTSTMMAPGGSEVVTSEVVAGKVVESFATTDDDVPL